MIRLIALFIKNLLRPLRNKINILLPRNLSVNPAVSQVYLGGEYETRYTLMNFPSHYSPKTAYQCIYDVALYSSEGKCVGKASLSIEPFGSLEVRPITLFGSNLPEFGMFTAKIRSPSFWTFSDRHLGKITSHFYALYTHKNEKSFALVHPQTLVDAQSGEKVDWNSGYLLDTKYIKKVIAIQINPTKKIAHSVLCLTENGVNKISKSNLENKIPAMGARMAKWDLSENGILTGLFSVHANGLPTKNAKPILLTYFEDGTFTGMHG
jgi:hypothetical protein